MTGKAAEKELAELVGGESQVYKVTSMGGDLSISQLKMVLLMNLKQEEQV